MELHSHRGSCVVVRTGDAAVLQVPKPAVGWWETWRERGAYPPLLISPAPDGTLRVTIFNGRA